MVVLADPETFVFFRVLAIDVTPHVRLLVPLSRGAAVSFGEDALRFHTKVSVDCGVLADGYDGVWTRNHE